MIAGKSARTVVSLHGKDVGVGFRNNLILAPAGCPLVTIDRDTDGIIFQGNLYWAGGRPFKAAGSKTCDSLEAWRKTGKEMMGGTAVGLFADPRLDLAAPRELAGDMIPAFVVGPGAVGLLVLRLATGTALMLHAKRRHMSEPIAETGS